MAEQIEPTESRADRNSEDQSPRSRRSADHVPAQPFVTTSESFGSFGSVPETGTPVPSLVPAPQPLPATSAPVLSQPGAAPAPGMVPPQPVADPYLTPATIPPRLVSAPYPYALPGQQGYTYPPGAPYAPGMPVYMPAPVARKSKKPVRFPLTRKAPVLLQIFGMLLYGLVMVICIMGCALTLLQAYVNNASVYFLIDGNLNGLSVLITCVLVLVLAPACSLFCGILFGSWRGLLVSAFSVSGGLLISHLTDPRAINGDTGSQAFLLYASLPLTALIVGLIYDNRKYAAWWKSMLTMFLGVALPVIAYIVLTYARTASDASTGAALAHTTEQNFLASLALIFGILALIIIPLLGLLYAGIEGMLHTIIARIFPVR